VKKEFQEVQGRVAREESRLYQIPESVTLGASQIMASLIRMWRTKEVRHVGSDTIAPGFWGTAASGLGEEDKGWAAGS
jgi:hypothetical protein